MSLLYCSFLPLFKGGLKDPANTDSYRAIAGSSLLLKLFDNLIIVLWGDRLGTDSLQFGFKSGTSTTECSWLVMEVASYFLRRGTPCLVTLLDCSKAFDTCQFSILFDKLYKKNLPAMVIRTLIYVYEKQTAWVSWGNAKSTQFGIVNGTRQGSVLSPYFFSVYIDELLLNLRNCHNLTQEFQIDPWTSSPGVLKSKYSFCEVPDVDSWRLPLLTTLLKQRYDLNACGEDTDTVDGLIESLCST